ncbi:MAG: response regulator, partial [Candidatus Sabulitectum sp.]|nr:response regulator [Candidatus Sabulitectum sp.]
STFSFAVDIPEDPEYSPDEVSEDDVIDLRGIEILIVDDSATNRMIQRETLLSWGVVVTEASDGKTALSILNRRKEMGNQFDIVLIDGLMPGMSGFEVASKFLSGCTENTASFMILTSTMPRGYNAESRRIGIPSCLLKPVKKNDLRKAISDALSDRRPEMLEEKKTSSALSESPESKLIKILAADDSSDNRFLLTAFLKKYPCELTIVQNGQEALEAFKESKFDIVLMDMQMPVMDGFAATRLIRKWETANNLKATPILALTAYALPEEIKHCTDAGCDSHVSKPVRKKTLIKAIKDFT